MKVGCVKEIKNNEFRVGMTPDNVKRLIQTQATMFISRKVLDLDLDLQMKSM